MDLVMSPPDIGPGGLMRYVLAQLTGPDSLLVWLFVLVSGL